MRLDSGDLDELRGGARAILDEAGMPHVRIFASGGLDEFEIDRLVGAGAPIDAFGVGTRMGSPPTPRRSTRSTSSSSTTAGRS